MTDNINHAALPEGYQLREYKLLRILGSGAFGIVYLAEHIEMGNQVAIKEYMPDFAVRQGTLVVPRTQGEDADNLEWGLNAFLNEAKTLCQFNHPNIIHIKEFFRENETAYMLTDYVVGTPLDELLKQQSRLSESQVKQILFPLLDGLKSVHQAQVFHRDIKPANIIIKEDGEPVLIDFGAAREIMGEKTQTVMFTPGYGAYEQYQSNGNTGAWTDIYGLAATMYHCLTGIMPPAATDRVRNDPLEDISTFYPNGTTEFQQAITAGLSVFDDQRPQNIATWIEALLSSSSVNKDEVFFDENIEDSVTTPVKTPEVKTVVGKPTVLERQSMNVGNELKEVGLFAVNSTPVSKKTVMGSEDKKCDFCSKVIKKKSKRCPFCDARQKKTVSKALLLLLTFFLGGFGGHKFYLGKHWQGVLYLIFCATYIPFIISLVEFITYVFTSSEKLNEEDSSDSPVVSIFVGVAVIGILAAVALPAYSTYIKKAKFVEVILASGAVKTDIETCIFNNNKSPAICYKDAAKINLYDHTSRIISSVTVDSNTGVISAIGTEEVDFLTYTLTPSINDNKLYWTSGGTCEKNGLC